MILYHGLSAFKGGRNKRNILKKAKNVLNHIACADKPIGLIGVTICGVVTDVFYSDCDSFIKNGIRTSNADHLRTDIGSAEEKRALAVKDGFHVSNYCEFFVAAKSVSGVWVKREAKKDVTDIAHILARKFSVNIIVI